MKCQLSLAEKLRDLRDKNSYNLAAVSEKTGIPVSTLQRLESNDDIRVGYQDIVTLARFYGVSMDYLTGLTNSLTQRNSSIDDLYLSDNAVEILKSRKVNNRLISELMSHSDFTQFMHSMEVYIDRKILPQMNTMNAIYKFAEQAIRDNCDVLDDDGIIRFLQEAVVDEDNYLRYRISERFNIILKDLFDKHKKDTLPDEQTDVVKDMAEELKYYLSDKSGSDRAKLNLWAKKLGFNVKDLSQEELEVFIKVIERSNTYKNIRRKR